ncbi:MAG: PhoPQ-activated protein PqaA family protein [Candidatus Bipolaricaulaceae bacterium]
MRGLFLLLLFSVLGLGQPPQEFFAYLEASAGQARWEEVRAQTGEPGKILELRLRSQIWRGFPWEHRVLLIEPQSLVIADVVLLYVTGDPNPGDPLLGLTMAGLSGLRVAVLNSVPNQPLFGLREDALIAYTFEQYLKTGESDWPLLFPMARSVLSAMDAISAVLEGQGTRVRGFVVAGASKRGWTTYLVAAATPERVLGIIPIVFDFLDFPNQIARQRELFGGPSTMLRDYAARGLTALFEAGAKGARLAWMVDPYSYRYAYTMPKLVIIGSNDPYWASDATSLYWSGLPEPKLLLVVPNAGHNVLDIPRVLPSVATFARAAAQGFELPGVRAEWGWEGKRAVLSVQADQPATARLWQASSPAPDLRQSRWEGQELWETGPVWTVFLTPRENFIGVFLELEFVTALGKLFVSTPIRIVGPSP